MIIRFSPILVFVCLILFTPSQDIYANQSKALDHLLGNNDSLMVVDKKGNVLLSKNPDKNLVPASTLKVLTSLVGIHYLGLDYRFVTEFYMDKNLNLIMKGYGDPVFVSETLIEISNTLHNNKKIEKFNDLVLDDSYFSKPIIIDGVSLSNNPYDAPNGALNVNFNTISFRINNGNFISAEPQTPLIPFALKKISTSAKPDDGRIVFSQNDNECTLYAGNLFKYFLKTSDIHSSGLIRIGHFSPDDILILRYSSCCTLKDVISKLLEYSNNYIANQIFIAAGAIAFGEPGTLQKGVMAANEYVKKVLKINNIYISEGSGISRKNKISARNLCKILEIFEPYHELMKYAGREFYKTGTLLGVSTRAGYIVSDSGELYRFALMVNTEGKSAKNIMPMILKMIN